MLTNLAATFKKYLEYDPNATLSLVGYADGRGPTKYNQSLSERRVQAVKDFLTKQGISEDKLGNTSAYGKEQQLDKNAVEQLQSSNPNPPPEEHTKRPIASWLAYNRRVDIVLAPKNEESVRFYPNSALDLDVLWHRSKPTVQELAPDANATPQ